MDVGAILKVRITRSANIFALRVIQACKYSRHNFELSILDCSFVKTRPAVFIFDQGFRCVYDKVRLRSLRKNT